MLRGLLAAAGACTVVLLAAGTAQAAISYTAYVGNYGSGTLTPVDAATNIAGAALPINDPSAIAITPDGSTAWVANHTRAP